MTLSTYLTNYFNDFNIYETMVTLLVIKIRKIPLLKSSYCAALLMLPGSRKIDLIYQAQVF